LTDNAFAGYSCQRIEIEKGDDMSIPNCSVEGKVTIVTGSSQGIGNGLARGFAEAGASVVLASRNASLLEDTVREIEAKGGKALAVPTDVTDSARVAQMVERTLESFGRIDVLINCAGGSGENRYRSFLDLEEGIWDAVINLSLKSVYLCCRAAGRVMAEQRSGSIINFSSASATAVVPGMTHYNAAKAGVNQFTKVLAAELGSYNVRVNAISPGLTDTPSERQHMPPELFERYSRAIPLGRVGQPEDILGTALFLASEASAYVTGAIVAVSGGPQ
jgi:NAD(P)-dependent dehydrogenase (short-subunit alcohol dehydrogenase family)